MRRRKKNGPPSAIKLLPDMPQAVFQQDCVPPHNATKTQKWCQASLPCFWAKGVRPGNSTDLSPIESLCAIVQHKVDKMAMATSEVNLIRNVRSAWRSTSLETLDVRDAEAHGSLCGKSWRLFQHINQDPAILCFLDIAGDRTANQFRDTLYMQF